MKTSQNFYNYPGFQPKFTHPKHFMYVLAVWFVNDFKTKTGKKPALVGLLFTTLVKGSSSNFKLKFLNI